MAGAGNGPAEEVGARLRGRSFRGRLGGMHVPVARSRMTRIAGEQALQHFVDAPDVGRIEVLQPRATAGRRARPRDEMKQRVGVEGADVEIVGIGFEHFLHRSRVGGVLLAARRGVETLDVAVSEWLR